MFLDHIGLIEYSRKGWLKRCRGGYVVEFQRGRWIQTWAEEEVDWWSLEVDRLVSQRLGAGGGVVSGGGVVFGVVSSSIGEKPSGAKGVVGGESGGVEAILLRVLLPFFSLDVLGMLMTNVKVWLRFEVKGDEDAMKKNEGKVAKKWSLKFVFDYSDEPDHPYSIQKGPAFRYRRDTVDWEKNEKENGKFAVIVYEGLFHPQRLLHAFLADTYSASVVEMASAVCFLENQDIRQQPKKVQTQLVLLRST
ncbi:hypothetical protein Tco_1482468 [Tanacetum coccineum]